MIAADQSMSNSRRYGCLVLIGSALAFIAAAVATVILFFSVLQQETEDLRLDIGLNQAWYFRRADWGADPEVGRQLLHLPLPYVLIGHSALDYCTETQFCINSVQEIQRMHLGRGWYDIGPNFLVGANGIVFEGRGANLVGVMVNMWNSIGISVMFLGDYTRHEATAIQFENVNTLLEELVTMNVLRPDYTVFGHCQVIGAIFSPDLPLPRYIWDVARSTSKAERISCAAAMGLLITCILLAIYFVVVAKSGTIKKLDDVNSNDWFKTREEWLYQFNFSKASMEEYEPVRLVIIAHTVSPECDQFRTCAAAMRNMQVMYQREHGYDIPYNFVIGNDGRVYEARGWNVVGAHTEEYNYCSISVAFIGNYCDGMVSCSNATQLQLQRADMLIKQGIDFGHIHKEYQVLGARDLKWTNSPGDRLYNIIRQWPHYAHDNVFGGRTCGEIRDFFENSTDSDPVAEAGWYISRENWGAPEFVTTETMEEYQPVRLVVISHTVTRECHQFVGCAAEMRRLQEQFIRNQGSDIPYNFMIGNDGRVYEARGWNLVGAHVEGYDPCSISVAFIGDYRDGEPRYSNVTELQLQRVTKILEEGVNLDHIHTDYQVLGTRDLRPTLSPGQKLYDVITQWPHYAHDNVFRDKTCQEIRDTFENSTTTTES